MRKPDISRAALGIECAIKGMLRELIPNSFLVLHEVLSDKTGLLKLLEKDESRNLVQEIREGYNAANKLILALSLSIPSEIKKPFSLDRLREDLFTLFVVIKKLTQVENPEAEDEMTKKLEKVCLAIDLLVNYTLNSLYLDHLVSTLGVSRYAVMPVSFQKIEDALD